MKRNWQITGHMAFWAFFTSFFMYLAHEDTKLDIHALLVLFLLYPIINIGLFYFNYIVLIPRFFKEQKYVQYYITLSITIFILGIGKYVIALFYKDIVLTRTNSFITYFLSTIITSLIFILLSFALKFTTFWFSNRTKYPNMESLRRDAGITLMESQTNAHFLFNSLNSIYSLAYQRSGTTPDAILHLSTVMHYSAYEWKENKIQLDNELLYLQHYVELQKLRFGKNAYLEFKVTGQVTNQQIAPMLLIPFVENAIKHGVMNNPLFPVQIEITLKENQLEIFTQNRIYTKNRDVTKGIGIDQVKGRLELLYPGRYILIINAAAETYSCKLTLDLTRI